MHLQWQNAYGVKEVRQISTQLPEDFKNRDVEWSCKFTSVITLDRPHNGNLETAPKKGHSVGNLAHIL